jgi:hypothetical protein
MRALLVLAAFVAAISTASAQTFNVVIEGAQEVPPSATSAKGSGTVVVDTAANTLTYDFTLPTFSSAFLGAHFHGPAPRGEDAGIKIDIGSNPSSGTVAYSEVDEADILAGLWYVNFHTSNFPGGEIRGQLDNEGAADPPRFANLSTRADVMTGENVMIAGFIIGGSVPKTLVVNVAGPSLANFGIDPQLTNPALILVRQSDGAIIETNDDWQAAANASDIEASGFAPNHPLEPAVMMTLDPGAYTAIVQGSAGETGTALVGVFEVDVPGVPLINLSTRARVSTGNQRMIAGFIIQGDGPQTVVINVAGPSLSNFGIANPLANPMLTLVRQSDLTVIDANDDWQGSANATQIEATGFQPNHPLEPAIIMTLAPGAYTAIVEGVGGTEGVAVVGVFRVSCESGCATP